MAIRTFNSVGGFSVGETPANIILANGDITTGNITLTANVAAGNVKTDNYLYANGVPVDFNTAVGNAGEIQFKGTGNDLAASINLTFTTSNSTIQSGNIKLTGQLYTANVQVNTISNTQMVFASTNGLLIGNSSVTFDTATNVFSTTNFVATGNANVTGNLNLTSNFVAANVQVNSISNTYMVFAGTNGKLIGNSSVTFDTATNVFSTTNFVATGNANVTGNINLTSNLVAANVQVNTISNTQIVFAGTGGKLIGNNAVTFNTATNTFSTTNLNTSGNANISGYANVTGNISGNNLSILHDANVSGNLGVLGDANITGDIHGNRLDITYDANIGSDLHVLGTIYGTFSGGVSGTLTAPGNNKEILFNDGGYVGSDTTFTYDKNTHLLTVGGDISMIDGNISNVSHLNFTHGGQIDGSVANTVNIISKDGGKAQLEHGGVTYITANSAGANITANNKSWVFDNSANLTAPGYIFANSGNVTANNFQSLTNIIAEGNIRANGWANIKNDTSIGGELLLTGNANVTANLVAANIKANVTANVGNLNVVTYVTSALIPDVNADGSGAGHDLGSLTHAWKDLYLSGTTIYLGATTQLSGASGALTTQDANIYGNLLANKLTVTGDSFLQSNANITGNLLVSGNLTVAGTTTYLNVTDLSVKDPLILLGGTANGGDLAAYDGKDRGIIYQNYYSSAPQNQFFGWKSGNSEFIAVSNVTSYTGEVVVSGGLANIRAGNVIADLYGNVQTSAQPYITSLGTLTDANISGNLKVLNTANVHTLIASGLTYPTSDGTNRQVLSTNGSGTLGWATIDTYKASNGTSNVTVYGPGPGSPSSPGGNVAISVTGVSNVVVVTTDGANITGNLNVSGDFTAGNVKLSGVKLGNTSIQSATKTTTSVTSGQIIVQFPMTDVRGVIFDVTAEEPLGGKYGMATLSALSNDTGIDYAVYGTVNMGGATGSLSVDLVGSNIALLVTPASSNSTVWMTQYRLI